MSCCSRNNLNNLNTTVYSPSSCCSDDNGVTIQFVDGAVPFGGSSNTFRQCQMRPPYYPVFPPQAFPPQVFPPEITPIQNAVTASYALFYNSADAGTTYAAGTSISFPSTLYNTDTAGIVNNNNVLSLSGGATGRAYLISYHLSGVATDATVGLVINGVTADASAATATSTGELTLNGSYIVSVPANTTSTVQLNVISGSFTASASGIGTSISVVRIA